MNSFILEKIIERRIIMFRFFLNNDLFFRFFIIYETNFVKTIKKLIFNIRSLFVFFRQFFNVFVFDVVTSTLKRISNTSFIRILRYDNNMIL